MKLMTEFYDYTVNGNVASGYSLNNLKTIDTNEIWKGLTATETLTIDLGVSKFVGSIFLNNANFINAVITLSNSSNFSNPVSKNVTLRKDDLNIIKAFIEIGGSYRYLKIQCSNLISGSIPTLGNIIIGPITEILVTDWSSNVQDKIYSFESDGGAYREKRKGQSRHKFSASLSGEKAYLDRLPLNFDNAVIYTDLGDVADACLVGAVQNRQRNTRNPIDCSLSIQLSEII